MTPAQTILKLIEEVSPDDTAALKEIDARVWCWLNNKTYDTHAIFNDVVSIWFGNKGKSVHQFIRYTRSRDSLKSIRPEGYFSIDENGTKGWQASINRPDDGPSGPCFIITGMPTEELAELHAIIQAIEYECLTPSNK